jgi:hypothetical protein
LGAAEFRDSTELWKIDVGSQFIDALSQSSAQRQFALEATAIVSFTCCRRERPERRCRRPGERRQRGRRRPVLSSARRLPEHRHSAGVPIPKFARDCSKLRCELRNQRDTSNSTMLVPLLNPKFANVLAAQSCELRVRGTSGDRYGATARARAPAARAHGRGIHGRGRRGTTFRDQQHRGRVACAIALVGPEGNIRGKPRLNSSVDKCQCADAGSALRQERTRRRIPSRAR